MTEVGYRRPTNLTPEQRIWWAKYDRYMKSWKWRYKREIILFLAGKRWDWWPGGPRKAVCQIHKLDEKKYGRCFSTRRVQVAHLPGTYKRLGHELLSDLLALCKAHHLQIDGQDAPPY